jgi:hypothetical protein
VLPLPQFDRHVRVELQAALPLHASDCEQQLVFMQLLQELVFHDSPQLVEPPLLLPLPPPLLPPLVHALVHAPEQDESAS